VIRIGGCFVGRSITLGTPGCLSSISVRFLGSVFSEGNLEELSRIYLSRMAGVIGLPPFCF
jgi:hypothetical protein